MAAMQLVGALAYILSPSESSKSEAGIRNKIYPDDDPQFSSVGL